MKARNFLFSVVLIALIFSGCRTVEEKKGEPDYSRPLAPGQNALVKITDPAQIPDFTLACMDLQNLTEAVANSINYMRKPSSKGFFPSNGITHEHAMASLVEFKNLLDSGLYGPALNQTIREKFDVYTSVGYDNRGTVLFTGYYTPIFDASWERTETFRYPLYRAPENLVKSSTGEIRGLRQGDQIVPVPARAQLENSGILQGNELVWLSDPFEVYIIHVQGSCKLRMRDGSQVTIGYEATNGHDYRSVSQALIRDGVLTPNQLNLTSMIAFFKNNSHLVARYVNLNPRFVFFRQEDGQPRGSINEPVIPYRSIATDKSIFPRASVTYLSTSLPQMSGNSTVNRIYSGFACDQDTGGAIRAPGRCDVYMGVGDQAGRLAGDTYQEGRLYYLFLKPAYMN